MAKKVRLLSIPKIDIYNVPIKNLHIMGYLLECKADKNLILLNNGHIIETNSNDIVFIRELTKEQYQDKLKNFSMNVNPSGILLFVPEYKEFVSIHFGDGMNIDNVAEGHDDYLIYDVYEFKYGEFSEALHSGQIDFNSEESKYDDNIINTVYDVLNYVYGYGVDFIPIQNYRF